jgi:polyisoprenyl-teichoic acid--peptidoglycan teichoic acid transferase
MRPRKQQNASSFWAGVAVGLLLSLTGLTAWWFLPLGHGGALAAGRAVARDEAKPADPVQVLVMGVDGRDSVNGERTDTMMLVRVEAGEVRILSIPRDTLVAIEGHGDSKINSAYTYGGAELAKEVTSTMTGLPVDYYVKIDLSGFRRLIDLLGGVWFDVPKQMYYQDPTDNYVIDLQPGRQLLDGDKAEQLVRFRHDAIGDDVGRIHRQQEFLKAAAMQALTPGNLVKLPQLLYTARQYVETDIPLTRQPGLAQALFRAQQQDAVLQETVPGQGDYVDGISFFLPDSPALNRLIAGWQSAPDQP